MVCISCFFSPRKPETPTPASAHSPPPFVARLTNPFVWCALAAGPTATSLSPPSLTHSCVITLDVKADGGTLQGLQCGGGPDGEKESKFENHPRVLDCKSTVPGACWQAGQRWAFFLCARYTPIPAHSTPETGTVDSAGIPTPSPL